MKAGDRSIQSQIVKRRCLQSQILKKKKKRERDNYFLVSSNFLGVTLKGALMKDKSTKIASFAC